MHVTTSHEKSILCEIKETQIAIELIRLGARMQILENETSLSRRKLLKLYKELKGNSPPKGMLPFSVDWYMAWEQNIHSSLFYNIYYYLQKVEKGRSVELMLKAYRIYLEHSMADAEKKPVLELTRAWTLLRFIDSGMLKQMPCKSCNARFIITPEYELNGFTCSLCAPPSRAIKKSPMQNVVLSAATTLQ